MWNNGDGVPVEIHKDEKVYVPELIFGHLLTSSNYNDSQKKVRVSVVGKKGRLMDTSPLRHATCLASDIHAAQLQLISGQLL